MVEFLYDIWNEYEELIIAGIVVIVACSLLGIVVYALLSTIPDKACIKYSINGKKTELCIE